MSHSTQSLSKEIDFDKIIKDCCRQRFSGYNDQNAMAVVTLLSLNTGLPVETIIKLKWGEVLMLGSDNEAEVVEELIIGRHFIPLNIKVRTTIANCYTLIGYPKLDEFIISEFNVYTKKVPPYQTIYERRAEEHLKSEFYHHSTIDGYTELDGISFEYMSQIVFGRKVFEVNGYSNNVCNELKRHYAIKSNKELFDFLGYKSKEEIEYNLSSTSLIDTKNFVRLKDNNFNNGYEFQSFDAFYKFLDSASMLKQTIKGRSIKCLLLMSLINGIKPSKLIELNWSDILQLEPDVSVNAMVIPPKIKYKNYDIHIPKSLEEHLHRLLQESGREKLHNIIGTNSIIHRVIYWSTEPPHNYPIFTMANGNRIHPNSLHREIREILKDLGFHHWNKFTTKSPLIMYARKVLSVKGDHKLTIQKLKQHFNFRVSKQLFQFLHIDYETELKGKSRETIYEYIFYDV